MSKQQWTKITFSCSKKKKIMQLKVTQLKNKIKILVINKVFSF